MTSAPATELTASLQWMADGTAFFNEAAQSIDDGSIRVATGLPGWTRAHILGHLALGASALCNLLHWASTGEEKLMYASPEQRRLDIDDASNRTAPALKAEVARSQATLSAMVTELAPEAWAAPVRTARGALVPAANVPWMRSREVWVHAVDLGTGATFDRFPVQFTEALLDEVVAGWRAAGTGPAVSLHADDTGRTWSCADPGVGPIIHGRAADLLGWALGRTDGPGLRLAGVSTGGTLPGLPRWL